MFCMLVDGVSAFSWCESPCGAGTRAIHIQLESQWTAREMVNGERNASMTVLLLLFLLLTFISFPTILRQLSLAEGLNSQLPTPNIQREQDLFKARY